MESEVQKFYKNKTLFITGGTGFIGKAIIYKILRDTSVNKIYLLVRPKSNAKITARIDDLLKSPIFDTLQRSKSDLKSVLIPIKGDCEQPNLGLTDDDVKEIITNVHVIFHIAATVNFNERLSKAYKINVNATLSLLELGQRMEYLQAFVHISTAFVGCVVSKRIEERYYNEELNLCVDKIKQIADSLSTDKQFDSISLHDCVYNFPNTYTFTKTLAEDAVRCYSNNLPVCIIRPCVVVSAINDPEIGWTDNSIGAMGSFLAYAHGFQHVYYGNKSSRLAVVPVDFCANIMLVSAWKISTLHTTSSNSNVLSPPIYNFVPENDNQLSPYEMFDICSKHLQDFTFTNMIWYPFIVFINWKVGYKILILLYHTIPAYIFDVLLMLRGNKPRTVKAYKWLEKHSNALEYFQINKWSFEKDNTKKLYNSLSADDCRIFPFDTSVINYRDVLIKSMPALRKYLGKEDATTVSEGRKCLKRMWLKHRSLQFILHGSVLALTVRWFFFNPVLAIIIFLLQMSYYYLVYIKGTSI